MATEERLRIRAEVVDNTSGPLRRISRELQTVGAQRVDNLGRSFDHVRSKLGPLESGISGIGMSMLRLAGPIGAVAAVAGGALYSAGKKLNEFAKGTLALNDMSKMTGFSITQIEKFSQVMQRLDIDRQEAQTGLASFAGNLFKFRTHTGGELKNFLGQRGAGDLGSTLEKFAASGQNDKALEAAIEYIEKLDKIDPAKAAILSEALFGDANFRRLSKYNDQLKKSGDIIDRNVEAAQKYHDTMSAIEEKANKVTGGIANKGLGLANKGFGLVSPNEAKTPELKAAEDQLARVNRRLRDADPSSGRIKSLTTEREELLKEIEKLKKGIKDLGETVEPLAKKMSFVGGGLGGGGGIMQASFGGGGGVQSYRGEGGKADIARGMGRAGGGGSEPGVGAARGQVGRGDDPRGLEGYIREQAIKNGIDPDTAVAVAKSEGLRNPVGDHGMSHGAFQLFKGGGLGNEFQKETGLDPADPANEKATIDFAMKRAAKGGWGPWHGAKNTGISQFAGIGGREGVGGSIDPHKMDPMAPAGSGIARDEYTTVRSPSVRSFKVKSEFAPNFQGLINDYEAAGGKIGPESGTLGTRGNRSYHPLGRAIDINQIGRGIRGRSGVTLPRDVEDSLAEKNGLWPGSRFGDAGHFEVRNRDLALAKQRQWDQERRAQMDKAQGSEMSAKVEGTGKLTVDVNGPKGTKVGAEGGGLFKEVQINRSTQMLPAAKGPREDLSR